MNGEICVKYETGTYEYQNRVRSFGIHIKIPQYFESFPLFHPSCVNVLLKLISHFIISLTTHESKRLKHCLMKWKTVDICLVISIFMKLFNQYSATDTKTVKFDIWGLLC